MQKWEYLFLIPGHHKNQDYPYSVNGQELKNWKRGPNLYDYCNQLGEEGWELVGYTFPRYGAYLTFKRPKQAGSDET